MEIKLTKRNVYGRELIYPACRVSEMLVKLTGGKTFSDTEVKLLQDTGYSVEWVAQ
jgi:hypothetical protein